MFRYAIALGSNRRHGRHGPPRRVLDAAIDALQAAGARIVARSPVIMTAPLGPSARAFANAAILIETRLDPPALLHLAKQIERGFGRRPGQRWGARVVDLDIVLWSNGAWRSRRPDLIVPHAAIAERRFVLDPLVTIIPDWRLAGIGTVRQARARLTRPVAIHRSGRWSGP